MKISIWATGKDHVYRLQDERGTIAIIEGNPAVIRSIVRAVNSGSSLLKALRALIPQNHAWSSHDPAICSDCTRYNPARAAIAQAEGETE